MQVGDRAAARNENEIGGTGGRKRSIGGMRGGVDHRETHATGAVRIENTTDPGHMGRHHHGPVSFT